MRPASNDDDYGGIFGVTVTPFLDDGSRVDEGSDHLDDYPKAGRRTEARLPFSGPEDEQSVEKSPK